MRLITSLIFLVYFPLQLMSQTKSPGVYRSDDDDAISIKKIFVAPFYDNVNLIYAPQMTLYMKDKLAAENQWTVDSLDSSEKGSSTDSLESSIEDRMTLMKKTNSDALLTSKIIKGPRGLSVRMTLYVGSKALPLLQESMDQIQSFEIEEIKKAYETLWTRIKKRMPYNGVLLSRRGSDVTINLGLKNGLTSQSEVRAVLILKLNRHPKLQFVTSSEKEILGKIQITKLDEYLSFGTITYEKEPGLLSAGMKVQIDEQPARPAPQEPKDKIAFGEKPNEWVPMNPPQYGLVGIALGLNQYSQSANLTTVGNLSATNNFVPTLRLSGELWLNEEWLLALSIRQSALAISNGLNNSSPERLNMSLSQQSIAVGYNFLVTNQFFGPKLQVSGGLTQFHAQVDPSSPVAFTSMTYGGLSLGFSGSFPLSEELPWDLGARFKYFWSPSTAESTASGAVTGTKINDFGFFARYRRSQNFNYTADFGFEYYSTDLNPNGAARPDPATSISHKITNLLVGIEYLF